MKHYIIPVFIPHYGCRHECIFCNQRKITGMNAPVTAEQVDTIIIEHLNRINLPRRIEVAFYGGSFTALSPDQQRKLLIPASNALWNKHIHAIRVSTRPDCINTETVQNLKKYGVSTIELGVQSLDNRVLEAAGRGHTSDDVVKAVNILKSQNINCGIQLMPGLPLENLISLLNTAVRVAKLEPDFVRIYPTIVIANTKLAELYDKGAYSPLTMAQAIRYAAYLKLFFERHAIPVIRTGLQATEELANTEIVLAGPYHPAFGEMVDMFLFYIMAAHCFEQIDCQGQNIVIHHHPRDTSKLRGHKNSNITNWRDRYNLKQIKLLQDGSRLGQIVIEHNNISYTVNKNLIIHV